MSRRPAGNSTAAITSRAPCRARGRLRYQARGISLIETLIAMALGLLVLAGVLQLTNHLVAGNTATLNVVRLEQDTRTALDIIIQDLRRAGSFPEAARDLGDASRFLQDQPAPPLIDGAPLQAGKAGTSIAYAYREADAKLVQARFSHEAKAGTIQMHTGTASAPETITDPAFMLVTSLSFVPGVLVNQTGSLLGNQAVIEVRISTRLKSDASVTRALSDRVVLRNTVFESVR